MSAFTAAVEHRLRGLHFFSVGAMFGCDDCGLAPTECRECCGIPNEDVGPCPVCEDRGVIEKTERDRDMAEEGHELSNAQCDSCGSYLAGRRHPAHGVIAVDEDAAREAPITHFDVCVDCLMWHANGEEPDDWEN